MGFFTSRTILLAGMALLFAVPGKAQVRSTVPPDAPAPHPSCRAVASVDDVTVGLYRGLFFDDDEEGDSAYAQFRAHFGVRKLAPTEAVVPVREPAVCHEWLPAILAALRTEYGPDHGPGGYLFEMIRYGPYMVVLAGIDMDAVPPGVSVYGRIDILVFEADGKRYLGTMLG